MVTFAAKVNSIGLRNGICTAVFLFSKRSCSAEKRTIRWMRVLYIFNPGQLLRAAKVGVKRLLNSVIKQFYEQTNRKQKVWPTAKLKTTQKKFYSLQLTAETGFKIFSFRSEFEKIWNNRETYSKKRVLV